MLISPFRFLLINSLKQVVKDLTKICGQPTNQFKEGKRVFLDYNGVFLNGLEELASDKDWIELELPLK